MSRSDDSLRFCEEVAKDVTAFVRSRLTPVLWSQFGEDVVQESFGRFFASREWRGWWSSDATMSSETIAALRPYLFGIARHTLCEFIRQAPRFLGSEDVTDVVAPEPGSRWDRLHQHIGSARRECSQEEWTVFEWVAFEDQTSEQIAARLKRKPTTIRSRLHRTRARLRGILQRETEGTP